MWFLLTPKLKNSLQSPTILVRLIPSICDGDPIKSISLKVSGRSGPAARAMTAWFRFSSDTSPWASDLCILPLKAPCGWWIITLDITIFLIQVSTKNLPTFGNFYSRQNDTKRQHLQVCACFSKLFFFHFKTESTDGWDIFLLR